MLTPINQSIPSSIMFDMEDIEKLIDTQSNLIFKNASDFSQYIELTALKGNQTCTSVILEYCDTRDIDPEQISKLISKPLKEKLILEMQESGLMRKTATLEFE